MLHSVLDALTTPELRNFAHSVLSQDSLAFPFVSGPASLEHHHNHPGGLLEHSLECTDIVAGMKWFPTHIRELGVVAALFHDIGKIVTMTGEMKRTSTGYLVDHDLLNLELLSYSLQILDEEWPDGARALRYILSWDKGRRMTCVDEATWVWSSDRATGELIFKLLLNDKIWCKGEDIHLEVVIAKKDLGSRRVYEFESFAGCGNCRASGVAPVARRIPGGASTTDPMTSSRSGTSARTRNEVRVATASSGSPGGGLRMLSGPPLPPRRIHVMDR